MSETTETKEQTPQEPKEEVEIPQGPIEKSPQGPVAPPQQTSQPKTDDNVVKINSIQGLSITDHLFHVKGDISVQASVDSINYFNFVANAGKTLQVYLATMTFVMDVPQLEVSQLKDRLSPVFYKLDTGSSLICFNQKMVSHFIFLPDGVVIVFKQGQNLKLSITGDQREQVFNTIAEHHETIIRS